MSQTVKPKYSLIYDEIRREIFLGGKKTGDSIPSEYTLCDRYGASRETVRKALRGLENDGLIYSVPKVGYFIRRPDHSAISLSLPETILNGKSQYLSIHGIPAPRAIADALGVSEGEFIISLEKVYYSGTYSPVAFEKKFLPYERAYPSVESEIRYAVFPDFTMQKLSGYDMYSLIDVVAVSADSSAASILAVAVGSPLALIKRTYVQQNSKIVGFSLTYLKQPDCPLCGIAGKIM